MHISMGVQGVTDAASATMLWSPITPDSNISFRRQPFRERYGVAVAVANDCNMIAEALRWIDPGALRRGLCSNPAVPRYRHGPLPEGQAISSALNPPPPNSVICCMCRMAHYAVADVMAASKPMPATMPSCRRTSGQDENAQPAQDVDAATYDEVADRARAATARSVQRSAKPDRQSVRVCAVCFP